MAIMPASFLLIGLLMWCSRCIKGIHAWLTRPAKKLPRAPTPRKRPPKPPIEGSNVTTPRKPSLAFLPPILPKRFVLLKSDVSAYVKVVDGILFVDGLQREVTWGSAQPTNISGIILDVDEFVYGTIKLESGLSFKNPSNPKAAELAAKLAAQAIRARAEAEAKLDAKAKVDATLQDSARSSEGTARSTLSTGRAKLPLPIRPHPWPNLKVDVDKIAQHNPFSPGRKSPSPGRSTPGHTTPSRVSPGRPTSGRTSPPRAPGPDTSRGWFGRWVASGTKRSAHPLQKETSKARRLKIVFSVTRHSGTTSPRAPRPRPPGGLSSVNPNRIGPSSVLPQFMQPRLVPDRNLSAAEMHMGMDDLEAAAVSDSDATAGETAIVEEVRFLLHAANLKLPSPLPEWTKQWVLTATPYARDERRKGAVVFICTSAGPKDMIGVPKLGIFDSLDLIAYVPRELNPLLATSVRSTCPFSRLSTQLALPDGLPLRPGAMLPMVTTSPTLSPSASPRSARSVSPRKIRPLQDAEQRVLTEGPSPNGVALL